MSLEDRVLALEATVAELKGQVGLEAQLRARVDEDLSGVSQTLRAQQRLIQALAEIQAQHTIMLGETNCRLDRVEDRLRLQGEILAEHTSRFDRLDGAAAAMTTRLGTVGDTLTELVALVRDQLDQS